MNSFKVLRDGLWAAWIKNVIFKKFDEFGFMKGQTIKVSYEPNKNSGCNLIN